MGYTTSIPEAELERGDGPPPCEGYAIDEPDEKPKTKAKVVEPEDDKKPVSTTRARTKAK